MKGLSREDAIRKAWNILEIRQAIEKTIESHHMHNWANKNQSNVEMPQLTQKEIDTKTFPEPEDIDFGEDSAEEIKTPIINFDNVDDIDF